MVQQDLSGEREAIQENVRVIRAKFGPLMNRELYIEDVDRLLEVVPRMLANVEAMADELDNAFNVLADAAKK